MDPKIDTFGQIDIGVLAILVVEKVVLWTFSKSFWSWLEMFGTVLDLRKRNFCVYFHVKRLINDP